MALQSLHLADNLCFLRLSDSFVLFQVEQQQVGEKPSVCSNQPALTEDGGHQSRQHRYVHPFVSSLSFKACFLLSSNVDATAFVVIVIVSPPPQVCGMRL